MVLVLGACPRDPTPGSEEGSSGSSGSEGSTLGPVATSLPSVDSTSPGEGTATGEPTSTTAASEGTGSSGSTTGEGACAIDLLFVIDNSGSMADEQARLLAAFPEFVADLTARIPGSDLHVMVTDVDEWVFAGCEGPGNYCNPPPQCVNPDGTCNLGDGACLVTCTLGMACEDGGHLCEGHGQDACDEVLGAGVDHTFGVNSSDQACDFASGARYIDSSEPDLVAAFECAAQLGTSSFAPNERPMESLVLALTPGTDAFTCNQGFLRDEALLVVSFITDEDDDPMDSAGDPAMWQTAVLDAKGGDPDQIAVLGLFGDGDQVGAICDPDPLNGGAEPSVRLRAFLDLWGPRGIFGSICARSYEPFFAELSGLVQDSCQPR